MQSGKKAAQAVMYAENKNIILLYQQNNGEPAAMIGSSSLSKLKQRSSRFGLSGELYKSPAAFPQVCNRYRIIES